MSDQSHINTNGQNDSPIPDASLASASLASNLSQPQASKANQISLTDISQVAAEDSAPQLNIKVNGVELPEKDVLAEMQYHQADTPRQAMIAAAEALILDMLLAQRCQQLSIAADNTDERLAALMQQEVAVPEVEQEECLRYFQANRDKMITSPKVVVDHILLAADKEDLDQRMEAKQQADKLLEELKQQPQLFSDFAARFSICPSKDQGGALGEIERGQTVPEFEKAIFRAEIGLMPYPLETRYGVHLVQVHSSQPGEALSFEQCEDKIRQYLSEKVHRKALSQYLQLLVAEADIEGFAFDVDGSPLMQ